jgi:hypothetical protein
MSEVVKSVFLSEFKGKNMTHQVTESGRLQPFVQGRLIC